MIKVQAYQKYIRVSPRKLKTLAKSVHRMGVDQLLTSLKFTNKKTARILYKTVKQAVSNAMQKQVDVSRWQLDAIQVFKGPTYKRWRAVSRGRGHGILKRTSHLKVVLRLNTNEKNSDNKQDKKTLLITKTKKPLLKVKKNDQKSKTIIKNKKKPAKEKKPKEGK